MLMDKCNKCCLLLNWKHHKKCPKCYGDLAEIEVSCELNSEPSEITDRPKQTCLDTQHGGSHYKQGTIQPIEYIHANDLSFLEGSSIKYITRNRRKGTPVEDLKKAIHFIQILLKLEHDIDSRIEYDAIHRD